LTLPIRVGIGGWVYPPWRGVFYPTGLAQARELGYASRQVTAIEINGTFYGAQRPASFRRWYSETPEDFVFSVKGSRYATHRHDLAAAAPSIERFFGSGVLELREKLGPIPEALDHWAERFHGLVAQGGRDCFVYFINGAKIRAPAAAQALLRRLSAE